MSDLEDAARALDGALRATTRFRLVGGRRFDAVFLHDAVSYMDTEADLRQPDHGQKPRGARLDQGRAIADRP